MGEPIVITPATIFFVHHGETEWNRAGRYQGRLDSPLTPEGRAQAARVAALLAREVGQIQGVRLVTSPLGRAVATARIIGATIGLAIATDARLVELSLGAWEGMTRDEITAAAPDALLGASRWDWYFRAPDGESFDACADRLAAFLVECREPAILVGHGVAGRILRGLYAGLARDAALRQKVSRDGVFKLAAGSITFLDGMERS
jgi:broad specificity phosphatase PhoE